MGQIIELPDIAAIKREIQELKKSLEELVFERDELRFVVCENIKMTYMLEIGNLEYRVYDAYCDFLRLRRKKEFIQAKKNRQEPIQMDAIDSFLDIEFQEYKKKRDEKIDEINQAIERSKMESMPEEEAAEFKTMYRSIVKSLHPDLNPDTTDAEQELFVHATEAYKEGDFGTLQLIFQMIGSEHHHESEPSSLSKLQSEKKRIQILVDRVKADIEFIKTTVPYIWRIYIKDENKKAEKISKLQKELKSFQEAIRTQQELINDLMRNET